MRTHDLKPEIPFAVRVSVIGIAATLVLAAFLPVLAAGARIFS